MPVPITAEHAIPRRLHKDAVFDHLVAAILDGSLAPGERLRDVDLERWLGVSRTPIRVALARLAGLGLVETASTRETRVVRRRAGAAADVLAAGCVLAGLAVVDASATRGAVVRADLAEALDGLLDGLPDGPLGGLLGGLLGGGGRARRPTAGRGAGATAAGLVGDAVQVASRLTGVAGSNELLRRRLETTGLVLRHHLPALDREAGRAVLEALDDLRAVLSAPPPLDAAPRSGDAAGGTAGDTAGDAVGHTAGDTIGADVATVLGGLAARLVAMAGPGPVAPAPSSATVIGPGRATLSSGVHAVLSRAVLDGVLAPGERLVDDELIAWLGVSRTPIRTALERLGDGGLVLLAANRYTRVALPDADDLDDARSLYAHLLAWSIDRPAADGGPDPDEVDRLLTGVRPWAHRVEGRPLTAVSLRPASSVLRLLASVPASGALARTLDDVGPRLGHAVVSLGLELPVGAWQSFETSVREGLTRSDGTRGRAVTALLDALAPAAATPTSEP
jgi:DNA-binding GntR family transcriptional regulator